MSYISRDSIAWAKRYLGYHEGYNNYNIFSPMQGLSPYNPWCASFACDAAVYGGGYIFPSNSTFGTRGEAYCPTLIQRAQQEGLWRDRNWRAQPGDFVLYDWEHDGVADHVEMVLVDDGVHVVTIGGNVSNAVMYRTRDRTFIVGFYALSQSPQVTPVQQKPKVALMINPPFIGTCRLRHPDGRGWWIGHSDGRVDFLPNDSDGVINGGMVTAHDRAAWADRVLAKLVHRVKQNGQPGIQLVATDGAKYIPQGAE